MNGKMLDEAGRRYGKDPEFTALVDALRAAAKRCGFTPYELKQAAYCAALLEELTSARTFSVPIRRETQVELAAMGERPW